jgi:hypothetical protein
MGFINLSGILQRQQALGIALPRETIGMNGALNGAPCRIEGNKIDCKPHRQTEEGEIITCGK